MEEPPERLTTEEGDFRVTTPDLVQLTSKEIQAVELRKSGLTFDEIARALNYTNRSAAWKAVRRALQKWGSEEIEEFRQLELARLDTITQKLWPQILGRPAVEGEDGKILRAAEPPDKDAMKLYLTVSERRSRLLGLDRPVDVNLTGIERKRETVSVVESLTEYVEIIDTLSGKTDLVEVVDAVEVEDDGEFPPRVELEGPGGGAGEVAD